MITYDDMISFYKDKKNIVDYIPQNDECNKLAETFAYGTGKPDDIAYSKEIKKRMTERTLTELTTFKYFTEEEACILVKSGFMPIKHEDKDIINPSQKWHLYVSYIAYQEVAAKINLKTKVIKISGEEFAKRAFHLAKNIKQPEYVKWIKKEATSNENSSWEEVKDKIKEANRKNKSNYSD